MLTLDQTLALISAGYTKDEIAAFETPAEPAEPAAPAEPEEPAAPAPQEPAPAASTAPAAPAAQGGQDQILQALERLTNSIMQHNVNGTVQQPPERTIEDALAEIIAPPRPSKR